MTDAFETILATWPPEARAQFNEMRALILKAAAEADVGPIEESLKWREPAWRPKRAKQGTTLRLNWHANLPSTIALFVGCQTTLSATMKDIYPTDFIYESNRGLRLKLGEPLPEQAIDHLARLAFTYHRKS
ncbi:DUF1801 domain-containing protein [uncultured Sulfitobacter sp.]|uniref:DUF1801 domain-containing protein n=1 Tax=uncultured Sulfitobacter sp. TaxID=191468 RepID=UPI0026251897|nr:DUF1801 domain-containing protein [uncultured Sulfitobacter sp.]